MPNVYVNNGTSYAAKEIFVNNGGTWQTVKQVYVNNGGTWQLAFPESTGTNTYTSSSSFLVPNGVYSITVSVYGAGGGAGALYFCGDGFTGGGGSSGGYLTNQTVSVTPGESLSVVVGAGGTGGYLGYACGPASSSVSGGSTYVARGATNLVVAGGGGGGGQGTGSNGPAGSPNGVQGVQPCNAGSCGYGYTGTRAGGQNGTTYGDGATATFAYGTQASGAGGRLVVSW